MSTGAGDVRDIRRRLPEVTSAEVATVVAEHYSLQGSYSSLPGERDRNFRLDAADGASFVVKISNEDASRSLIDLQLAALQHIARQDASLPVPAVVPNAAGNAVSHVRFASGAHFVHLLKYLDGIPLVESGNASLDSFEQLGRMLGRLDLALRGFHHAAADQDHLWNLGKSLRLATLIRNLPTAEGRAVVAAAFERCSTHVIPALPGLRHQVIHQDAHSGNVLLDPGRPDRIAGIIDFGDILHGSLVAEIAAAADASGDHGLDVLDVMCAVSAGFDTVLPLEDAEIDLLYDVIVARHAMIATIAHGRAALEPEAPSHIADPDRCVDIVDRLLTIGHTAGTRMLRSACRFPAWCPASSDDASTDDDENALFDARKRLLGEKTTHFYERPQHFERARGVFLYGTDGRRYLDCYNNVPQVGHCNPHVVKAIARQAAALNTNTRYLYSSVIEYAERLTAKLAPHLDACVFVNSGSEANDVAWQMAQRITGRSGAIVMEDAYHGVTESMRRFSPAHPDTPLPAFLRGLTVPDPYRGPYRSGEPDIAEKYAQDTRRAIDELAGDGHELAAFMIDSAFCSSGVPDVPAGYLQAVERHVREAGGLMICDEVQSGFGRMGQWWGHELHGVRADFVTMGKPVANGHPFGVVVTTAEILNEFIEQTRFFSTFGGNTVACAAANAVIDVIEHDRLIENGVAAGDYLRAQLRALAARHTLIGDVRGHGMLTGLELVTDRESRAPASGEVQALLELMRERRVLVGKEGRFGNILKLRPPLVFESQHVDLFIAALDDALAQL